MDYRRSPALVALLTVMIAAPSPALAHNESVHQRMTDYAYHVMLAAKARAEGGDMSERLRVLLQRLEKEHPGMKQFYAAAGTSVRQLREMKSGLPVDETSCVTQGLIALVGGGAPNWELPSGTTITDARMEDVRLPVTKDYGYGTPVCGLDEGWDTKRHARLGERRHMAHPRSHGHDARLLVRRTRQGGEGLGAALHHARSDSKSRRRRRDRRGHQRRRQLRLRARRAACFRSRARSVRRSPWARAPS